MPRNIILGETFFFLNFCIFWAKSRISYTWSPQWVITLEKRVSERGVQWNPNKKLCLKTLSWERHFLKKLFAFFWLSPGFLTLGALSGSYLWKKVSLKGGSNGIRLKSYAQKHHRGRNFFLNSFAFFGLSYTWRCRLTEGWSVGLPINVECFKLFKTKKKLEYVVK